MGIINWMQKRLNVKQDKKRPDAAAASSGSAARRAPTREENGGAGEWPLQGLLSIGTLGNESPAAATAECGGGGWAPERASSQDVPDFTIEEVRKLQEALNNLLRRAKSKSSARGSTAAADVEESLPLDRFLNCPSSLEVDRRVSLRLPPAASGENGEFSPDTQIILSKARDLLVNSGDGGAAIKQKSFKFLLKKMFACRGGFAPAPSLKDPVESRIEKLFRTMLHKRMNARPSNAASSRKYYLEDKPRGKMQIRDHHHDDEDDNGEDIFKWDKTDTDFIVLEM